MDLVEICKLVKDVKAEEIYNDISIEEPQFQQAHLPFP